MNIWPWSRIRELEYVTADLKWRLDLSRANIENQLRRIEQTLNAIAPGVARVVAKLDPQFGRSEFDPERIAESKKLEEETIKRLRAEAMVTQHYGYNKDPE